MPKSDELTSDQKVAILWGAFRWIVGALATVGIAALVWLVVSVLRTQGLKP